MSNFEIVCLQGSPLASWIDEVYTVEEIREKFWDYAKCEGMFDSSEDQGYFFDQDGEIKDNPPKEFTLDFISSIWEVELSEVKDKK